MRRTGGTVNRMPDRKRGTADSPSSRPWRVSTILPPLKFLVEMIAKASEKEKQYQYENYRTTGDFERDFTLLSNLVGLQIPVNHRQSSSHIRQPRRANSASSEESMSQSDIEDCSLKISTKTENEYFVPRIDIEIEYDRYRRERVNKLFIRGWIVDSRIMDILSKIVADLTRLTELNLWNAGLVDETLNTLSKCVKLMPSLKILNLDGNDSIRNQEFGVFLDDQSESNLQYLSLRYCNINEIGAKYISNSLSTNQTLLSLNVSSNKLGNRGASHLAISLRVNRCLVSLNISNNLISDDGVESFTSVLSTFPLTHKEVVSRRKHSSLLNEQLKPKILLNDKKYLKDIPSNSEKASKERLSPAKNSRRRKSIAITGSEHLTLLNEKIKPMVLLNNNELDNNLLQSEKATKERISPMKNRDSRRRKSIAITGWDDMKAIKNEVRLPKNKSTVPEDDDPYKHRNPIFEKARTINGELWIPGNRCLFNLNLSRNQITQKGLHLLHTAIKYQKDMVVDERKNMMGCGLMKLSLHKNNFMEDDTIYIAIRQLMGVHQSTDTPLSTPKEDVL